MWTILPTITGVDSPQKSLGVKIFIENVIEMINEAFYTIFDVLSASEQTYLAEYPNIGCIGIFSEKW